MKTQVTQLYEKGLKRIRVSSNIIFNTGWLFVDKLIRMTLGMVVVISIARYLGPHEYGVLNYAQAFVMLFTPLFTLGLDGIVVKYLVHKDKDSNVILGTAFLIKLIGGVITSIAITLIIFFIKPHSIVIILVLFTSIGYIFQCFDVIDFWFQSKVKSKFVVYAKTSAFVLSSTLKMLLVFIKAPVTAFAVMGAFESLVSAIGLTIVYKINKGKIRMWKVDFKVGLQLLKESWPLILSGLVIMIYMRMDQLMLGQMKGEKAVGIYTAALKFSEVWYFIPVAIVSSLSPSIAEARKNNLSQYYAKIYKMFKFLTLLSYSLAILMTFLSAWIIEYLYGPDYKEASVILAIHIWTAVFVFLGVARGPWLINENSTRFSLATNIFGAVVNFVLNLILIPRYGGTGAAISTLIAQIFASYLSNVFYRKTRILFYMQTKSLFLKQSFK